jgi:dolichyl-phosphate-mannose-protein mannosyltransferase
MRQETEDTAPGPLELRDRTTRVALAAMLAGALVFRLALVPLLRNKPTHDLRIFVSWAQLLMRYGSHGLYLHVDTIDHYPVNYPPLFAVVLGLVDGVYRLLVHGGENLALLGMLLKVPAIVADVVLCILVFVVVRRWTGPKPALGAVALAAFAPSTWPISVLWGQVDSICTMFMLLALTLALSRRYTLAWSALALAVLIKPLPVVVAPLLLAGQLRDQGWSVRLLAGPACAALIAYVVALPFAPTVNPLGVMHWLAIQYTAGQSLTDATSVNAYNFWTLAWPVTSDSAVVLGLTLHTWGWLAFSAILSVTTWTFFQRLAQQHNRVVQGKLTARAWFIVLVAVFLFLTRMHERYILFSLALAPLMWFCGSWERRSAITLISTFTICVTLVLGFYEHGWLRDIPAVTHLLSLINLAAFAAVAASFFGARRTSRESTAI